MKQPANGRAFNLGRFGSRLRKKGARHNALSAAIINFTAAASRVSDLNQAQKSLSILRNQMEKPNDKALLGALFTDALLHYCRAIYTRGRPGPEKFKYYENFSDAEKAAHNDLTQVRDKVVAHYTTETMIGGQNWVPATAAVRQIGSSKAIAFVTTRYFGDRRRADELQMVTTRALELAEAYTNEWATILEGLLLVALKDPEIAALLEDCDFDVGEMLKDPAELASFWNPKLDGKHEWGP